MFQASSAIARRAATSSPRATGSVVGFAGLIFPADDGHITNLAVDDEHAARASPPA